MTGPPHSLNPSTDDRPPGEPDTLPSIRRMHQWLPVLPPTSAPQPPARPRPVNPSRAALTCGNDPYPQCSAAVALGAGRSRPSLRTLIRQPSLSRRYAMISGSISASLASAAAIAASLPNTPSARQLECLVVASACSAAVAWLSGGGRTLTSDHDSRAPGTPGTLGRRGAVAGAIWRRHDRRATAPDLRERTPASVDRSPACSRAPLTCGNDPYP